MNFYIKLNDKTFEVLEIVKTYSESGDVSLQFLILNEFNDKALVHEKDCIEITRYPRENKEGLSNFKENIIFKCEFVIEGVPKSKSNHSLTNKKGKKILPANSVYAKYEKNIIETITSQYKNKVFDSKIICVIDTVFKSKEQHTDLNNMPKSVCDGIEKSGIIKNDRNIVTVYLNETYDYNNPRIEVSLYDARFFKPKFEVMTTPPTEIEERIDLYLGAKKAKKSTLKRTVCCASCGENIKKTHAMQIKKENIFVCNKCLVLGISKLE